MNLDEKISGKCMEIIKNNVEKSEEEFEKIQYGIKIIIINLFKFIILFLTAYFLGVLNYCIVAVVSFGILRTFASGVHAESSIKCIFMNYVIFLGNVFLSLRFSLNIVSVIVIYTIGLILIILYSPADTAERPLVSKRLRKSLKIKSIVAVELLIIISIMLPHSVYRNIIIYSVLEEAVLITPIAYALLRKSYKNYKDLK
ncbi:accessory gene regulator B family protein [Clostridium pasteurianum]|uniref:accessory gene regulator B family protein n=1 Tax=Clostridium pasteurianum TaxID=1501 RepID=UPI002260B2A5|nr:accessory gene regulator B family protein [Clostridium pasteurianum]UZW14745.1 accessory gene regulator B family protein [Clostridium pasteurianum]